MMCNVKCFCHQFFDPLKSPSRRVINYVFVLFLSCVFALACCVGVRFGMQSAATYYCPKGPPRFRSAAVGDSCLSFSREFITQSLGLWFVT